MVSQVGLSNGEEERSEPAECRAVGVVLPGDPVKGTRCHKNVRYPGRRLFTGVMNDLSVLAPHSARVLQILQPSR